MRLEDEIKQKQFKSVNHKATLNILYTANWIKDKHTRFLKQYGISPEQYNILRILRGQHPKPATVNLLIERMLDKMSNASRLVEKLRLKGLVDRQVNAHDRRAVDVLINKKGLTLLTDIDGAIGEMEKVGYLNEKDAENLNRILDEMRG